MARKLQNSLALEGELPEDGLAAYSPATGRAAVLAPHPGGALEVLAVLGMSWRFGKVVSRRSLRGLRPLAKGGS